MLQVPEFEASFGVSNTVSYTNVLGRKMRRDFFTPKPVLIEFFEFIEFLDGIFPLKYFSIQNLILFRNIYIPSENLI